MMYFLFFFQNFLYKFLGAVVRKSNTKDFVNKHITTILNTVKHSSQLEREVSNAKSRKLC